jgi:hypothetical protein
MAWSSPEAGSHQRVPDETFATWMSQVSRREVVADQFWQGSATLGGYLRNIEESQSAFAGKTYNLDLHIFGNELFEIPSGFADL